jgi:hypothetical protein
MGYDVEFKLFPIDFKDAVKRDNARQDGVGEGVLYKQWQQWLKVIDRKVYTGTPDKPKAVIFDMDGTLAKMKNRTPFEWDKVYSDDPDAIVTAIAHGLHRQGYRIIITSGRDAVCRVLTEHWLIDKAKIKWDDLFMRKEGDMRSDVIVKEEIFWNDIAPNYNVVAAVDDRQCIVKLWLELGIKVVAVGNPFIEF